MAKRNDAYDAIPREADTGNGALASDQSGTIARGERVILRKKRIQDAPDDYRWRCDPELARYDAVSPYRSTYQDFLALFHEELDHPSPWSRRYAIEAIDGHHVGNVMYYDIDERAKQAELGILIGEREYWSSGYGTDVVRTLVRHVFDATDLQRVYLHTLDWNVRAQRCFLKSGFVPLRTVQRNGHTFILMEVRRQTWTGEPVALEDGQTERT